MSGLSVPWADYRLRNVGLGHVAGPSQVSTNQTDNASTTLSAQPAIVNVRPPALVLSAISATSRARSYTETDFAR